MIARLRGKLEAQGENYVIVNVGGIGFKVRVPTSFLDQLGDVGSPVELFTHLHVRENELALYGCATEDELTLFEQLLTVSGIGPKAALGILSALSPDTLRLAIAQGQVDVLTQVPGIGKKTAQRLVLDLKGKLDLAALMAEAPALTPADAEVIAALTGLGYSVAEAQAALRSL
ncbi:MAG TPA: Holliday junction branch migration protein RuvA, partial [Anaerolineae bacterium]|nr:Holliday junction branch migration protein RuvA [Anaerolineae bacterium]